MAALGMEARMTVVVRTDMAASAVRELAKAAATPDQARRLLAIALVLEGVEPRGRGPQHRHGPADPARLGASLQRGRARRGWSLARLPAGNGN